TWAGRPVYVVGARAGDVHTRQFWIDRERLVFVRMLEPAPGDSTRTSEVRFNKYAPLAGGWIAPEVEFLLNGERRFLEEYRDVRANVAVAADLFVAKAWKSARRSSR
ncbi:MAG: hypothetical protein ACREMV_07100, partial [Gemmatimonadales bacterium]